MNDILLDCYYPIRSLESERAEKIFRSFLTNGFCYNDLFENPDYLIYPSANTLLCILNELIQEIIKRKDEYNFIIYGVLTAIDPEGDGNKLFADRCHGIKNNINKECLTNICHLLKTIEHDPPIIGERIQRIKNFWGC